MPAVEWSGVQRRRIALRVSLLSPGAETPIVKLLPAIVIAEMSSTSNAVALIAAVSVLSAAAMSGCATIIQGTTQGVAVSSSPTGARVWVNGVERGTTPMVADLSRKDQSVVKVELDGFLPYELAMTRSASGWIAGNIVFGGLIGLGIDALTGGMYKLSPEQVQASLGSGASVLRGDDDVIVIGVVLMPDPAWEQIGTLARRE